MKRNEEFHYIQEDNALADFCETISSAEMIAFDTEFVSEDCYQPQLCLIQVAAGDHLAIIDSLQVSDLMPFWNLIANGQQETVVHAAREEFRFCRSFTDQRPANLVDTQVAAGLIGLEYPAAYSTLVNRMLDESLQKNETRTNWRKRPLTKSQMEYAIDDVRFLQGIYRAINEKLRKLERLDWLHEEMDRQQTEFENQEGADRWRRIGGSANLSPRELVVIRELWSWREEMARSRNTPPRRILRDDLIVELAKRGKSKLSAIRSVRGMEYGRLEKHLPNISKVIGTALQMPQDQWPGKQQHAKVPNLGLLGQFLATALSIICKEARVAPNLAGSIQDLRKLAAWRLNMIKLDEPPRLATGWRQEVIGDEIDKFISGESAIRVRNPKSDQPLKIE